MKEVSLQSMVNNVVNSLIRSGEFSDLKHHCGIGGYEINQLMTDFGGSLEIILDAQAEFPVEYRLTFKAFEK